MYTVDDADHVVELSDLPQSDVGAPLPAVIASEQKTFLVYYLSCTSGDWDGTSAQPVSPSSKRLGVAVISLQSCRAHMFGPPNDEAFNGHPLAARGLAPYGVFEVQNSSWIRSLERMNSVHPHHSPALFEDYRHLIFTFHDSTFECIATGFDCWQKSGSVSSCLEELAQNIG